MFERIIRFAIEQRWLVMVAVLAMAALGVYNYQRLAIDAVPDIKCPSSDQHPGEWLLSTRNRTAGHLSH
jgi:Cu/Ag efflux pump CusA